MKTFIQNSERIEKVKRFLFSFHMTLLCLMFPLLFLVGIHGNKRNEKTAVYKQNQAQPNPEKALVTVSYPLPDQQS